MGVRQKKVERLFQGPESDLGQKTPGSWHLAQCLFHCVTHGPETQTTRHMVKEWARGYATWMARLLELGAGSSRAKTWRIMHCYRNLFTSSYCSYPCGCLRWGGVQNSWLTAWTKALTVSQRVTQESPCFLGITVGFVTQDLERSEEKPTIHKGLFILRALLFPHFAW